MTGSFLREPPVSPRVQALYDEDTAAASALGDSYCSLAWGGKLGTASDAARRSAMPGSMTGRSSPSPASWLSAWRFPRSTTPSVPSPTRNSPGPCPRRCARPLPTAGL